MKYFMKSSKHYVESFFFSHQIILVPKYTNYIICWASEKKFFLNYAARCVSITRPQLTPTIIIILKNSRGFGANCPALKSVKSINKIKLSISLLQLETPTTSLILPFRKTCWLTDRSKRRLMFTTIFPVTSQVNERTYPISNRS